MNEPAGTVADVSQKPQQRQAPGPARTAKLKLSHKIGWVVAIAVPLLTYFLLPSGGDWTPEVRTFISLTVWALLVWALDLMPVYVAGIALTLLYIFTNTAAPATVFEPWTGMVVWLTLGGLTLATVFEKTGLLDRIAFGFIALTGGSYRGIIIGLALSGVVVGLLVPNMTGRVALYAALTYGIIHALGLKPNTKAAAGIMFGGFIAATASAWYYLSANENLQLINSYLADAGEAVTWVEFFIGSFVPAVVFTVLLVVMTLFMFRGGDLGQDKEYFHQKYRDMGRLSAREVKFLIVLIGLVLAMVFMPTVAPGWLFMAAVVICFIPGVSIASGEDLKEVNYMMVFFVAATMSIGSVAAAVGLPAIVIDALLPLLSDTGDYTFLLLLFPLGAIVNLLMTPLAGMTSFVPLLIELSTSLGLSPTGAAFAFVWSIEQLIFPYEWALFLILFSFGMFDMKKAIIWSVGRMALAFAVLAALLIPFWMFTGFL